MRTPCTGTQQYVVRTRTAWPSFRARSYKIRNFSPFKIVTYRYRECRFQGNWSDGSICTLFGTAIDKRFPVGAIRARRLMGTSPIEASSKSGWVPIVTFSSGRLPFCKNPITSSLANSPPCCTNLVISPQRAWFCCRRGLEMDPVRQHQTVRGVLPNGVA